MFKEFHNNAQMMNLGNYSDEEINMMKERKIEFSKKLSKLMSNSRKESKSDSCFYCGMKGKKICNSHSIPSMFLKNIESKGYLYNNNIMIGLPLIDDEIGINKTGVFHIICTDCDSKIFSDYENRENYNNIPTGKMIAQIAMKNFLKNISKRKLEIALYDNMKELGMPLFYYDEVQSVNKLDLKENIEGFKRARKINEKGWENEYYLNYYIKLPYVVPLAFQGQVTLQFDLEGNLVNDIYYKSEKYKIQPLHLCVFPQQSSSIIIMFFDSKDKRYRLFNKQFQKLEEKDKLSVINYIIFSLSEDFYLSKNIDDTIISENKLSDIAGKTQVITSTSPIENPNAIAHENLNFAQRYSIPNLLTEEYKVDFKIK